MVGIGQSMLGRASGYIEAMAAHALAFALGLASATAQPIVARGPHVSEKGDVGTVSLGDLAGVETVHLDDDGGVAYSHGAIVPSIPYLAATPDASCLHDAAMLALPFHDSAPLDAFDGTGRA